MLQPVMTQKACWPGSREIFAEGVRISGLDGEEHPGGLDHFRFPSDHHRRIRTTNGLERLNREIRRRSRVAVLFPNEASCLRLVSAIVMEISEEWQTGRTYIRLDNV